ncbi:MAG: AI-2E family transporter [Methylophaga sp.]|nr:AI-2E family transporter [Methylophaga sp.]
MTEEYKIYLILIVLASGWLFYLLSPILMPFFVSALFAYLGDPIVDKLEEKKLSRTVSVSIVFGALVLFSLILLFVLLPMLTAQVGALFERLPEYLARFQTHVIPWLASTGFPVEIFNIDTIKQSITNYWAEVGQVAGSIVKYMTHSGVIALQWLANLVLIPVLTFYLLRDWDLLVARFRELIPRRNADKIIALSLECDEMLAAFLRGQLMVMLALATIYTIGLALIGLELALLLGVVAGIVSFVPYLGLIVGIGLAGLAAFLQFHEWLPVLMVVGVFSVAQMIEGMVLTPRFVGERIGLHPVAVLFAVMAGAQLFGFTGILLALPVAAVVMVLLRHAHQQYIESQLYI